MTAYTGDKHAQYELARYHSRRGRAVERLGGRCVVCGSTENLEFDHIDAATKTGSIGSIWSYSEKRFLEEVDKCQLLCHEHHVDKTRVCGDHSGGRNRVDNPQHGTEVMYRRERCRCETCRQWKRDYRAGVVDARGRPTGKLREPMKRGPYRSRLAGPEGLEPSTSGSKAQRSMPD